MSIRQRFIFLVAGCIAGFISILLLLNHTLNQLEQLYSIESQLSSSHIHLQSMARQAQNYSLNNQADAAAEFEQLARQLQQGLKSLEPEFIAQTLPLESLQQAIRETDGYHLAFETLKKQKQSLGLTPVTGMYGQLRQAVHQAEKEIKAIENPALTAAMLMLRRHEKDFMLRHQVKYVRRFEQSFQTFTQQLSLSDTLDPSMKDKIQRPMLSYRNTFRQFVQVSREVGLNETEGALGQLNHQSQRLIQQLNQLHKETRAQIEALIASERRRAMILALLLCSGLSLLTIWLAWRVVGRINLLVRHMTEISDGEGNLTVHLNSQSTDELGELSRAFNRFIEKIRNSVSHAAQTANTLEDKAGALRNTANQTLTICHHQDNKLGELSQALSETSAFSSEIEERIRTAKHTTEEISEQSANIAQLSHKSRMAGQQLIVDVEEAVIEIEQLEQDSQKISDVMSSIAEIAAQTNLLALNAAIEAARAGEQGRGFAVVADEVRNLSLKTQTSAEQINQQIETLQEKVRHATQAIRKTQSKTTDRLTDSSKADDLFATIEQQIRDLNHQSQAIARLSQQQGATMICAEQQLADTQQAMQSNLSASENNQATSDQLSELSGLLKKEMGRFTV